MKQSLYDMGHLRVGRWLFTCACILDTFYGKYCRRGLPVGTAVASSVADLADRTRFFQSDEE